MTESTFPPETQEVLDALHAQLERYVPDRYPVQHATTRFHIGTTLLAQGDAAGAREELTRSAALFPRDGLPVEHAKATNMLGVALRDLGATQDAGRAFEDAAELFSKHDQPLEAAAASYNLGLVRRDLGDDEASADCFRTARATFLERNARTQAAAAGRELGTSLHAAGDLDGAAEALEDAIEIARESNDLEGIATASTTLGVVRLAQERPDRARAAFDDASGASPRTVRPAQYAMARSNVALACERVGAADHAIVAARQSIATPEGSPEVHQQAREVLDRLGDDEHAVLRVLDAEPTPAWVRILREEGRRLTSGSADDRMAFARAWAAGQVERPGIGADLAETWLEVVLEQPPADMRALIEALVAAGSELEGDARATFHSQIDRAMPRFHIPQWMRLKDTFNDVAVRQGSEPTWG